MAAIEWKLSIDTRSRAVESFARKMGARDQVGVNAE